MTSPPFGRRRLLHTAAFTLPALHTATAAFAGEDSAPSGLVTRQPEPKNLEFPFASLDSYLTPNERFYVRSHFKQPTLEARDWRLKVEGAVERPFELTYDELRQLPTRSQTVTLECAGNGRVLLVPRESGVGWEYGAVSNAEWTGVSLAAILERAGVKSSAVEVILEGADKGAVNDEPKSPGEIHYSRSLPLEKARKDVLLATRMNGDELPPEHGFPVRAIVPGWYGMASIKWLTRIVVVEQPFNGYFQSLHYTYWKQVNGSPTLVPLSEMPVKAQIARPAPYEVVRRDRDYRVHGAAWTGEADIARVEVSTDGGASWQPAKLVGEAKRYAWRRWEYSWRVPKAPGKVRLMARATDSAGRTQPMDRDRNFRNYMICHVLPVDVQIR